MYRRSFITSLFAPLPAFLKVSDEHMPPGEIKDGQMLRIWKLGNLERNLYPTDGACQRLADILHEWDHVSSLDIIWGPDLELQQCPLDGSYPIDLIQINHSVEHAVETLVKNIPQLEQYKQQMLECLEKEMTPNAKSSSDDNT